MATVIEKVSKLKLIQKVDVDGQEKSFSKTYSNLRAEATDDALLDAGTAIGNLMALPPVEVRRIDELHLGA